MEQVATTPPWAMIAYLLSGVLFILALRGLSSPETSRAGNRYGMIGMLIAVVTTLVVHPPLATVEVAGEAARGLSLTDFLLIFGAIAIGAVVGLTIARRIAMTSMPQLVAAFHSLVGLAAVLVGLAAWLNPGGFGLLDAGGQIFAVSRVELALGAAIGAITFSGSVIAFAKLNGNMSGTPILLPARHLINFGVLGAILVMIGAYVFSGAGGPGEGLLIPLIVILAFLVGFLLIIPIGGADMPVVVSMLN
ncbi:MAG: NAD(P)(+) transhydrogenase (Re/Si-specific) subunit beta, partial [Pacificimonas sp.]